MTLLNPAMLFPLVWLIVVTTSPFSSLDFYPYSELFYWYLSAAVALFTLSVILSKGIFRYTFPIQLFNDFRSALSFKLSGHRKINLYILAMFANLLVQGYDRSLLLGSGWWTPGNVVLFRFMVYEWNQSPNFPWVSALNFFFFTAIPILLCHPSKRWQRVAIFSLLIGFVYLSSARASIFTIALIAYFFDWQQHGFRLKLSTSIAAVLLGSYYGIGAMAGKDTFEIETFAVANYAIGPSHALDQILSNVRHDQLGAVYMFPFLHNTLHAAGLIPEQIPNLAYYFTPHATNVYTIFGPYVLDFGIYGSLVCIASIGIVSGLIFWASRSLRDPYLVFLQSVILTLLCLSIFHDQFTSAGYVWASICLGFFFFTLSKRIAKRDSFASTRLHKRFHGNFIVPSVVVRQ